MASLYWLEQALPGLLPALWMSLGVGLPWALAALPRRLWSERALVAALALALGPAWVTAWLLLLGLIGGQLEQRVFTPGNALAGSIIISICGAAIAWRKRSREKATRKPRQPLAFDEKLIIALIGISLLLRWIHTAFWPFTAYDALWVYGYQPRLYLLEGFIPQTIGYYPQFLQLQFTFVQILTGINDHAARMVLPMLHIGTFLAAYLLGERLINRRAGIISAAIWSLHPYVAQWSYVGDLEIPLTFSFTLAAALFLRAWLDDKSTCARRYSILAGIVLGIALFTKPTSGAFIWAVLLLLTLDLALKRFQLRAWLPRFQVALWTGLACFPLGAVWYLRNLLLGHEAITFPKSVWLTRALRGGDYLLPLIVAAITCYLAVALRYRLSRRQLAAGGCGIALLVGGLLASNATLFPARGDPPASYVSAIEAASLLAGLLLMCFSLRHPLKQPLPAKTKRLVSAAGWALLLALPYFITFFISYSYHYRLGFAIAPLLCLPTAIAIGQLLEPGRLAALTRPWRRLYHASLVALALPGIIAVAFDSRWHGAAIFNARFDSDNRKLEVFNPSLMQMVYALRDYERDAGDLRILAPGEERLPFFFPAAVDTQLATRLEDVERIDATHIVYSDKAREAYEYAGIQPDTMQLVQALGRQDLFSLAASHYDAYIGYELYEAGDMQQRHQQPALRLSGEVIFGERLQLVIGGAYPQQIHKTTPITVTPRWLALEPLERDYQFVLQLRRADNGLVGQEWILQPGAHRHGSYAPTLWDVGEVVKDTQVLRLADDTARPRGVDFHFFVGVWDPVDEAYLPMRINGEPAGEFLQLDSVHRLRRD